MASLAGKVFAVTGGSSGMGLATCRRLASLKAKAVCIGDFNTGAFDQVRKELQEINPDVKILTTKLDVASRPSVDAWIKEIVDEVGALDGAVNCAGVAQKVGARGSPAILEETDELWERTMGVNLNGVFFSTRAEIKAMLGFSKSGPRSIVNISSMASFMHGPDCYAYGVSKVGVAALTTSISKDVLSFGIRVNTVSPSATKTPMLAQFFDASAAQSDDPAATMNFQMIEPEDIAEVATWLLSDDSSKISGSNVPVGASAP